MIGRSVTATLSAPAALGHNPDHRHLRHEENVRLSIDLTAKYESIGLANTLLASTARP